MLSSVEFLRLWDTTRWVLTAITPDGPAETATFEPGQEQAVEHWITARDGVKNLYFHVNPVKQALTKKAQKGDVAAMAWLQVDLDADNAEEKPELLKRLTGFTPPPTCVIDSGGGYQAFWKLNPVQVVSEHGENIERLEAYNRGIACAVGGDNCFNLDRIMRLPGTINLPTATKAARGRTPVVARLLSFQPELTYSLETFEGFLVQATEPLKRPIRPSASVPIENIPDVSVEDLQAWASQNNKTISDLTLAIIATGEHPITADHFPSRSEAVFRVCCDLVRVKLPNLLLLGVLLSPNAIGEHVRTQPNPVTYAERQIERATEEVISPELRQLNDKHAVIEDLGGRCRVITEVYDPTLKRPRLSKQTFEDFKKRYLNQRILIGRDKKDQPQYISLGDFWLNHPNRQQYEYLTFMPGEETTEGYNLWRGFAVSPQPGKGHESLLAHIRTNVCGNQERYFDYLMAWMARCVQHPAEAGEVAVVVRGKKGTGKSFFVRAFGHLFGRHFFPISDSKHMIGAFNAHLRDAVVVFGEEAFYAGDRRHESVLKTLITEKTIIYEAKGVDAEVGPNFVHLIMASNERWVVPAGADERRFFVLNCSDDNRGDQAYFGKIQYDLDSGGYSNLLHYFQNYDLNGFDVRKVPQTAALFEQKEATLGAEEIWLLHRLSEKNWLLCSDSRFEITLEDGRVMVARDVLHREYLAEMKELSIMRRMSVIHFSRFLQETLEGLVRVERATIEVPYTNDNGFETLTKKRTSVYVFAPFEQLIAHWREAYGDANLLDL